MNILCIGEVICDVVMKPIKPGDFANGRAVLSDFEMHGGGDANNASIDLAILGETVRVFSRMGDDFLAERVLALLNKKGVDTRYVLRGPGTKTTVSVLMLGEDGELTMGGLRVGASRACLADDIPQAAYDWADHVHLVSALSHTKMDGAGTGEIMRRAHLSGCTTSMDTNLDEGACMAKIEAALQNCDVFLPSHYEAEVLTGLSDPREIAAFFKPFGLKAFGLKRGADGVYLTDYREEIFQPSLYRGVPVDVIGAGDAFSATFAVAWKRGYGLRESGVIASAASACVVGAVGTTAGMRPFDELIAFARARGAL